MPISVMIDNKSVDCKFFKFSDGACNVQIDPDSIRNAENYISITLDKETVDTCMAASVIIGSIIQRNLKFRSKVEKILNVPYLPYGRADREFEPGMANCVEVFLDNCGFFFDKIITVDAHNPKSLDNKYITVEEMSQKDAFVSIMNSSSELKKIINSDLVLCAPDKGAKDKTEALSEYLDKEFIVCEKDRNPLTGWINSVILLSETDITGKDILIVDDICDGGGTFVKTAEALKSKGARKIYLYVTHGIFSKELVPFKDKLDGIFTYHIVGNYVTDTDIQTFNR